MEVEPRQGNIHKAKDKIKVKERQDGMDRTRPEEEKIMKEYGCQPTISNHLASAPRSPRFKPMGFEQMRCNIVYRMRQEA